MCLQLQRKDCGSPPVDTPFQPIVTPDVSGQPPSSGVGTGGVDPASIPSEMSPVDDTGFGPANPAQDLPGTSILSDDCAAAVKYVDSSDSDGLVYQLDVAIKLHDIHRAGLQSLQDAKTQLLSDTWWARSSGPEVASQIKVLADEIQDMLSAINPAAAEMSAGKDALIKTLSVGAASIKAAYENRQSVKDAAVAAAASAEKELAELDLAELAKIAGQTQAYSAVKALRDYQERLQFAKDRSAFRDIVQDQIQKLDALIDRLMRQVSDDTEKITAINELHNAVMEACVQKSVPIGHDPFQ
jgi:hypothetical protein